jgi:hypothetical protein
VVSRKMNSEKQTWPKLSLLTVLPKHVIQHQRY